MPTRYTRPGNSPTLDTLRALDFFRLVTLLVELYLTTIASSTTRGKASNCASISRSKAQSHASNFALTTHKRE